MSGKIVGLAFELDLNKRDKFVLVALSDHADHQGKNAFPSVRLLSNKTGYSQRSVKKALRSLESKGIIEPVKNKMGGRGKKTTYNVHPKKGEVASPFKDEKGETDTEKGEVHDEKGETDTEKGEIENEPSSKRPSNRQSNRPSKRNGSPPGPTPTEFKNFWNQTADEHGLKEKEDGTLDVGIGNMTKKRSEKLRTRRGEEYFVENWKRIIRKAFESSFLTRNRPAGPGDYSMFTVNWVLKNEENYTKILEGQYDDGDQEDKDRHYGGDEDDRRKNIEESTSPENAEWAQ